MNLFTGFYCISGFRFDKLTGLIVKMLNEWRAAPSDHHRGGGCMCCCVYSCVLLYTHVSCCVSKQTLLCFHFCPFPNMNTEKKLHNVWMKQFWQNTWPIPAPPASYQCFLQGAKFMIIKCFWEDGLLCNLINNYKVKWTKLKKKWKTIFAFLKQKRVLPAQLKHLKMSTFKGFGTCLSLKPPSLYR